MPDPQPHPYPGMQEWLDKYSGAETITQEMNDENPMRNNAHPHDPAAYEPLFPRESFTHYVLAHITDEVDALAGGVPRNTQEAVGRFMVLDNVVPYVTTMEQTAAEIDRLHEAGLIEHREDGSYYLTNNGWAELTN